jgi:hypothetical protein
VSAQRRPLGRAILAGQAGQAESEQTGYTPDVSATETLAFVVQRHELPDGSVHWDLMFEQPGVDRLATWQLPCPPDRIEPGRPVQAKRIGDHRKAYLTYEGPVSNNRGRVTIHSRGTYTAEARSPKEWRVTLQSEAGTQRMILSAPSGADQWHVETLR